MKPGSIVRVLLQPLFIALVLALGARLLLLQIFSIPSGSMSPTLQVGDHVIVTPYELPWREKTPGRGDVVVFRFPSEGGEYYVKRIVGVPGDHFEIREGAVRVDGSGLTEPYVKELDVSSRYPEDILPAGSYFVMGDNRLTSYDSRDWGLLAREQIVGKVRWIFWSSGDGNSPQRALASGPSGLDSEKERRVRWNRIGRAVH